MSDIEFAKTILSHTFFTIGDGAGRSLHAFSRVDKRLAQAVLRAEEAKKP